MNRCLPPAVSILANLGGGAIGIGIAYLLGPVLPVYGGEARQLDREFYCPSCSAGLCRQSFFRCSSAPTRSTAALALQRIKGLETSGPDGVKRGRATVIGAQSVFHRVCVPWETG